MMLKVCVLISGFAFVAASSLANLSIDFNSTNQDGGPNAEPGFLSYDAGHEVAVDFTTQSYSAFGTTITLTPAWPNSADNRVMQMIDRGASFDGNWTGSQLNLVTDFIGTDTRTGNGGNGDYDGTTGTPTYLTLTVGGLPAGDYDWTSFHHDTEYLWAGFEADVSVDGGISWGTPAVLEMSSSSTGGNPQSPTDYTTGSPVDLPSTYMTSFTADGVNDVVVRYAVLSDTEVHRRIFGVNGFTLIPEPSTSALLGLGMLVVLLRRRG